MSGWGAASSFQNYARFSDTHDFHVPRSLVFLVAPAKMGLGVPQYFPNWDGGDSDALGSTITGFFPLRNGRSRARDRSPPFRAKFKCGFLGMSDCDVSFLTPSSTAASLTPQAPRAVHHFFLSLCLFPPPLLPAGLPYTSGRGAQGGKPPCATERSERAERRAF